VTFRHLLAASTALALIGCAAPPMAPTVGGHIQQPPPKPAGAIPAPVQVPIAPPRPQPAMKTETYSVVVNSVRVHELLFALARDAQLNIDIHPGITGAVTLNAIDQTLPQLLNRISKQVDMRYELDGPNLLVMPDTPFLRVYKINYVNMSRNTKGKVAVSAQIGLGAGDAGGGSGGTNNSSVEVTNDSNNRFWDTLVANVKDILRETDKILPTGNAAAPAPVQAPAPRTPAAGAAGIQVATAAPAPTVTFREAASVISNPESGVLFIRASSRQHEKIREFLDQVLVNARRQVLIEATLVEVELNNDYQQGIDWKYMSSNLDLAQAAIAAPAAHANGIFSLAYKSNSFNLSLQLLEKFGTARVLSSPRINVLNNQTAILKVVDETVYFTISAQTSQSQTSALTTFTTTPHTQPVGFVMNVTPQISESDTVILNVKPTISRIVGAVQDPNPALNPCLNPIPPPNCSSLAIKSEIPEIRTREMESVMKIASGDIAVMGGLIQDGVDNSDSTIPGVNRIPFLGDLFANRTLRNVKTELVIFVRPIVVKDASLDGDFQAYRVFLPDENFLSAPNPGRPVLPDTQVQ